MVVTLSTAEGRKFVTDNDSVHSLTDTLLKSTEYVRSEGYSFSVELPAESSPSQLEG